MCANLSPARTPATISTIAEQKSEAGAITASLAKANPKFPSVSVPPAPGPRGADSSTRSHLAYSPSSGTHEPSVLAIPPALGRWSYCSTPPPGELCQVENFVWWQHGVTKTRDLSDRLPTCVSGHILSRVEILEVSDPPVPYNQPKCCACSTALGVDECAFTCYRCVKKRTTCHYPSTRKLLRLDIPKELSSAHVVPICPAELAVARQDSRTFARSPPLATLAICRLDVMQNLSDK